MSALAGAPFVRHEARGTGEERWQPAWIVQTPHALPTGHAYHTGCTCHVAVRRTMVPE